MSSKPSLVSSRETIHLGGFLILFGVDTRGYRYSLYSKDSESKDRGGYHRDEDILCYSSSKVISVTLTNVNNRFTPFLHLSRYDSYGTFTRITCYDLS